LNFCEELKTLSQKFGNVFVAAIMSGKLQKESYEHFLDNVIQPHVKKDNFMLILESWGGQTNPALYSKKFLDKNNELTCSLNIISQKMYTTLSALQCILFQTSEKLNYKISDCRFSQQLIVSYLVKKNA
jgi:hypothetical protein